MAHATKELADVFAIYFVEPFLLTIMSALFLGERVGWMRWSAKVWPTRVLELGNLTHTLEWVTFVTESELAERVLNNWDELLPRFIKIMPNDLKRVLEERQEAELEAVS